MRSNQSPLAPIFMMHHWNIDRIWWVWDGIPGHVDTPDPLWNNMPFQNNFFNPDGTRYSPKVSDLLSPEPLGYTYDVSVPVASGASTATVATTPADGKFKALYVLPNIADAKTAGIATYVVQNTQPATPAKYLEIAVEADANLVGDIAHYKGAATASEYRDVTKGRQQVAGGPRAVAFIRDIDVTQQEDTMYRVFINCDYLSPDTPISDPSYVGTFGFFGDHGGHGGKAAKPSVAVDLTAAIQRVYGSAPVPSGRIRVQILPVSNAQKDGKVGTATPGRVEVAFVSA